MGGSEGRGPTPSAVTWRLQFTELAAEDVADAYARHNVVRSGLGEEFLKDLDRLLRLVIEHPEACLVAHRTLRRGLLNQFPYSVYYRLLPATTTIEVRACVHQRQHDRTWRRRA